MYNHSKDYLLNYSKDKELWLKYLINKVILTNGVFKENDDYIKTCYDILVNGTNYNLEDLHQDENTKKNNNPFYIKELNHISGVNVLKDNQKILFNDNITILFGQNGSGKSGYFRILNEICGGNEKKDIIPNVYSTTIKPVQVSIKNSINNDTLIWNNTSRGIPPYNKTSVYDTSYMKGLIEPRNTQEALIEPFGLHLFSSLIKYIEVLKQNISEEISNIRLNLPNIDTTDYSDKVKTAFINKVLPLEIKNYILDNYSFNEVEKIEELEKKISTLKSTNIQTEISLRNQKYLKAKNILNEIKNNYTFIVENNTLLNTLIEKHKNSKVKVEEYQNKIDILNQIPSIDTAEWKEFITSADKYNKVLKQNDNVCIYCRNPLNKQSIELINAYSEYLNNDIIQTNNKIENSFKEIENKLSTEKTILIDDILKEDFENLNITQLLNEFNNYIKEQLFKLKNAVDNKSLKEFTPFEISLINDKLNSYITKIQDESEKLKSNAEKRKEEITKLEKELVLLKEKQSIANQKENINNWINQIDNISNLEKIKNSINTTQISTLSKKAHNELLTEKLKSNFEFELKKLGFKNLDVNLVEAGASKGIVSTKLVVSKNIKITEILSEGEQRAVSLAMFLSEISIRNDINPIILDDPVNSLDHKVMKKFVERLLELDNQIIIFTHNILFLSYFENSSNCHICKNYSNGCSKNKGKHIYLYDIKEETQTSKGIIMIRLEDNYETHIELAKDILNKKDADYERSASIQIRYAIECLIDEKILLNIEPQKYSGKNNRINWENLEKLGENKKLLECLKNNYDRLSGGKTHRGLEELENPPQEIELKEIIDDIEDNCIEKKELQPQ